MIIPALFDVVPSAALCSSSSLSLSVMAVPSCRASALPTFLLYPASHFSRLRPADSLALLVLDPLDDEYGCRGAALILDSVLFRLSPDLFEILVRGDVDEATPLSLLLGVISSAAWMDALILARTFEGPLLSPSPLLASNVICWSSHAVTLVLV